MDKHLGTSVSEILTAPPSPYGTQGYIRRYEKGSIYFVGKAGKPKLDWAEIKNGMTIRVSGNSPIGIRYETLGGSSSKLGFPVLEVQKAWQSNRWNLSSKGSVQFFEGGSIYYCLNCGAYSLLDGKIRDVFAQSEQKIFEKKGKELTGGLFGFPVSEQMEVSSSTRAIATVQRFEYGLIIDWSGGVLGIVKGFYILYRSMGEWTGLLGFPLSNEEPVNSSISGVEGRNQYFENGCMVWNNKTKRCLYIEEYGFPKTNPYGIDSGFEQLFEGGKIKSGSQS